MATLTATPASTEATPALVARGKIIAAFVRMLAKAQADKTICYKHLVDGAWDGISFDVPSNTIAGIEYRVIWHGGKDWANLTCTCKASHHLCCTHRAVVAWARRWHATAVRPRCAPCDDRLCPGGCPDAPEAPTEPIRRCVTCRTDPALADGEQCAGCAHVYPRGQAVAEQEALATCTHGVFLWAPCAACRALVDADPVEARHRALTAQRVATARAAINPANPLADLFN